MKTLEDCRKAMSQAISRAYGIQVYPVDISTEYGERDVRDYVSKTAGHPHPDVTVPRLAALALSRCLKMPADEALASSLADLIDGGVSLDRQAAASRGLTELMAHHRRARARANPLPADLKAKARENAPTVVRRSGESAIRRSSPPPAVAPLPTKAALAATTTKATPSAKAATPPARSMPAAKTMPARAVATTTPTSLRVAAGSYVKYRRLDDESEHELFIGSVPGAPAGVRSAPLGSPVAEALLGATRGTVVSVTLGPALVDLEVLEVRGSRP